jgi:hypothetical protein
MLASFPKQQPLRRLLCELLWCYKRQEVDADILELYIQRERLVSVGCQCQTLPVPPLKLCHSSCIPFSWLSDGEVALVNR